ncbi:hypothetical protein Vau01_098020 [Virgisporangium aurantiacum]|uniref:Uncharacterized protein n=1 Tax=Virgisporangium aurantiacum TaxID=175570 RepID=A0A8J3ZIR9_9ACTN|nr:hypothetical protein Vau01_098020 [Virgisporangium aurantiacum]
MDQGVAPDLCGLRHPLADPALRVRLEEPAAPAHTVIEAVTMPGEFLLGGTGAGKSLLIELVRFFLDQHTDAGDCPTSERGRSPGIALLHTVRAVRQRPALQRLTSERDPRCPQTRTSPPSAGSVRGIGVAVAD